MRSRGLIAPSHLNDHPSKLRALVVAIRGNRFQSSRLANVGEIASVEEAHAARDSLQSKPVVVSAKAGESGRLFGAITTADIASALGNRAGVDKRRIQIAQPIKALGDYQVQVSLHDGVVATVDVQVVAAK